MPDDTPTESPYAASARLHESIGYLVSSVGRYHVLRQAEQAEANGSTDIAAQLRDWAERLTLEEAEHAHRLIKRAAAALEPWLVDQDNPATYPEEVAEVALRGAGVIR